jgi:hypothetical protein
MNRKWSVVAMAALFGACAGPTRIMNSWKAPSSSITQEGEHKIVVAALLYDQGVRRQVEDYMASVYTGRATQSYLVLGKDSLLNGNEQQYSNRMKEQGFDDVVIMKQTNERDRTVYVPGRAPSYATTWQGAWRHGWGNGFSTTYYNPGTPGHYANQKTWIVQVDAFSLSDDKLVWSANTSTTNPGGRVPLFEDVCNAVRAQMKKDGFLQ